MATRFANNLDYAEVNNCVNGVAGGTNQFSSPASDGDIIQLPPGNSSSWTSALVTPASTNIQIIGAGIDKTSVTPSSSVSTIINGPGQSNGRFFSLSGNLGDNQLRLSNIVINMTVATNNTSVLGIDGRCMRHLTAGVPKGGYRIDNIRFRSPTDKVLSTTIATGATLPQATIQLVDTTGWTVPVSPSLATARITTSTGVQVVSYSGISGNSLTGCTGGTGVMSVGGLAQQFQTTVGSQSDLFILGKGTPGTNGSFLSGSVDHCFIDYITQVTGSELFDCSGTGSPDGTAPDLYGQWCWGVDYVPGGGFDLVFGGVTYDPRTYIEDNIWHRSGLNQDANSGGSFIVSRHNTSWGGLGTHGMETGNNIGPRFNEQYNNHVIGNIQSAVPAFVGMSARGGGTVFARNRFTDYGPTIRGPYVIQPYRRSATSSGMCGPCDGTNFFDLNWRGTNETTIAAGSNGASLPQATINVASSTSFAASGTIYVNTTTGTQAVAYTGKGTGTFTGCTGGTGTMSTGGAVVDSITYNTQTFAPLSTQVVGNVGAPGVPTDTRIGAVYAQSANSGTTSITLKVGVKYTLKGLVSSVSNHWQGFTVRNLTNAPAESVGGQGVQPSTTTTSYALISTSISTPSDATSTDVNIVGPANGIALALSGTDKWEIRRVKQAFCAPGADKLPTPLNGGNNSKNIPLLFTSGSPNPRWINQTGYGIWQKNNTTRPNVSTTFSAAQDLGGVGYAGFIDDVIPGLTHNGAVPGSYSLPTPTAANLRIGADWTAPGYPALGQIGCETFQVGDLVNGEYPAGQVVAGQEAYGGLYPNSAVTGTLGTGKLISLSGDSMAFGTVSVGSFATQNLIINNFGTVTLAVSGITYPNSVFSDTETFPFNVLAGASHTVTVKFTPLMLTLYQGNLTVASNADNNTSITEPISGSGFTPSTFFITLSGNMSFGTVQVNSSTQSVLTISNTGQTVWSVTSISDGVGDGVYTFSSTSFTIQPSASQNVTVTFHPTVAGTYNRNLTVTTSPATTGSTNPIAAIGSASSRKIYFKYHKA